MHCCVEYTLTVKEESEIRNFKLRGVIRDVSPGGFGLVTEFPLIQGNMLKIKTSEPGIPTYGVVRWVNREGDSYRAGLRTCSHHGEP